MARRGVKKKVNLWQQLTEYNEKFQGDDSILGMEMLGFPRKTDAPRGIMYISHLGQRLNVTKVQKGGPILFVAKDKPGQTLI